MRRILIALAMIGLAGCMPAQRVKEANLCGGAAAATIDQRIAACDAILNTATGASASELWYDRGIAYARKREFDQAIADFTRAIALKPDYAKAFDGRGAAYGLKGELDPAIADFTKAISLKPDYALAYNNRGAAYFRKGLKGQAAVDRRMALKLNPNFEPPDDSLYPERPTTPVKERAAEDRSGSTAISGAAPSSEPGLVAGSGPSS